MIEGGQQTLEREQLMYERLIACLEADGELRATLRAAIEVEFPDFGEELREFFDGLEILDRIAAPLRLWSLSAPSIAWGDEAAESAPPAVLPSLSEYEFVREIARGGMGVVYEARHRTLGRSVALKMIRSGARATEDDVRRFREEARRVAQLDHPAIIPLYAAGHGRRPPRSLRKRSSRSTSDNAPRLPALKSDSRVCHLDFAAGADMTLPPKKCRRLDQIKVSNPSAYTMARFGRSLSRFLELCRVVLGALHRARRSAPERILCERIGSESERESL
jgi:hypothetical protein